MTARLTLLLMSSAVFCAIGAVSVAHAEAGTDPAPVRADLSANFSPGLHLAKSLTGRVSSSMPAHFTAQPTILTGGAIGTSDLRTLVRLKAVTGKSSTESRPLLIRLTLAQRRTIRRAEQRAHRHAVLGIRLTGTFDSGATAEPHYRQFVIDR